MEKICQKCGTKFECLANEKCWCNEIKLADAQFLESKSCYDDCFCKKCLVSNDVKLGKS